jgi:hypothetical protein
MMRTYTDQRRDQNSPGRYDAVIEAALLANNPDKADKIPFLMLDHPAISGNPRPEPLHKRDNPRPRQLNLVLGRIENAQKSFAGSPEITQPALNPAPAPTPAKGNKMLAAMAAFADSMFDAITPPPRNGQSANGPGTYTSNMSIGGLRPQPS